MKVTVFWDVTLHNVAACYQHFRGTCCINFFNGRGVYSCSLKIGVVFSFENLVINCQTAWHLSKKAVIRRVTTMRTSKHKGKVVPVHVLKACRVG
jgi:hypothetical protein